MISVETLKKRSLERIGEVHMEVKKKVIELIDAAYEEGIAVQMSSGYRSHTQQAAIYGQGRPGYHWNGVHYGSAGRIVTYAEPGKATIISEGRSTSSSFHPKETKRSGSSTAVGDGSLRLPKGLDSRGVGTGNHSRIMPIWNGWRQRNGQ